ncbi:hypothetical protein ACJ72_06764 [Emergomyces africanus]|uniref:Uncharacterized protein n=1 Tax=Emergomyces africanus TaxID=1955775 RepID=A0A1B7NQ27_9EURO|nr:hypothetical protein ACJ72_06764 [Emergomyces africanus]
MPTNISILVYIGSPLDYVKYRHTAVFLRSTDGTKILMHVKGTSGLFEFEDRYDYNPDQSDALAKTVPVAELPDSISSIKSAISSTVALTRLVDNGYLSATQRIAAVDQMASACSEAKDEDDAI